MKKQRSERIPARTIETINTLLFVGAGLYAMWYVQKSVRISDYERGYLKILLENDAYRNEGRPENQKRIMDLVEKFKS